MRCIKEADYRPTIHTDIVVNNPAFVVVIPAFVVRLVRLLGERVINALVENLFSVVWSGRSLCRGIAYERPRSLRNSFK